MGENHKYLALQIGEINYNDAIPFMVNNVIVNKPGYFLMNWVFIKDKLIIKEPLITLTLPKMAEFLELIGYTLDELKEMSNGKV